jgi:hypothetical protein
MNNGQKIIRHIVIQSVGHFVALAIANSDPKLEKHYHANKWEWHLTVSLACLLVSYGISRMPKGLIPLTNFSV